MDKNQSKECFLFGLFWKFHVFSDISMAQFSYIIANKHKLIEYFYILLHFFGTVIYFVRKMREKRINFLWVNFVAKDCISYSCFSWRSVCDGRCV